MRSPKTVLVIGILLVGLAFWIGWAVRDSRETTEEATPTPTVSVTPSASATPVRSPVAYTVRLLADGVTPRTLTIRVGDTVSFTNDTDTAFWPASDPHPTHTLCPGFDAHRALQRGETYTLAFTQSRTCTYHDHVAPQDTTHQGTIIVQ